MNPSAPPNLLAISLLMFVDGMGIPLMATLNAGLGAHLASPFAAGTVLMAVGLVLSLGVLAIVGPPPRAAFAGAPWYLFGAAAFMLFYLLSITWSAPRIGIGNAVFLVLLGQLVAAAAIDHNGWFGALRFPLTARRTTGILVMALGVYLVRKPR